MSVAGPCREPCGPSMSELRVRAWAGSAESLAEGGEGVHSGG